MPNAEPSINVLGGVLQECSRDPLTGVEVWAVEGRFDGVEGRASEAIAAVVDPALAFTAENAARSWRGEGFYRADPQNFAGSVLNLYADGTTLGGLNGFTADQQQAA